MEFFMGKIRKILNKCYQTAQLAVLFVDYLIINIRHNRKKLPENKKTILFTLEDDRLFRDRDGSGRYAYMTLNIFNNGGYTVYLYKKMNFRNYRYLGNYGRLIYSIKNLKIINVLPENTEEIIYAFDTYVKEAIERKWKKKVYVNILKSPHYVLGNVTSIPYYFHPLMYKNKQNKIVHTFRSNTRKIKIFFGGNFTAKYYDNSDLKTYYNQMTRREGIRAALSLGEHIEVFENADHFHKRIYGEDFINKCIILQTDHTFPIKPRDWLNIVSSSNFFLCLSGTDLPMCHNVIESMAVGTIPIIAYQDWFFPPLEHKKNAILYSGKEDLIVKIQEVLAMSVEEIKQLQQNTIEYYEKYLTTDNFIKRFEDNNQSTNTIILHPRYKCTIKDAKEGENIFNNIHQHHREYYVSNTFS